MRLGFALAATAAFAVPMAVVAKDTTSPVIAKALADPARADQAKDDARRQAAALVAFSGLKPGQTVVDFLPGAGYWTRIFTGVVGAKGHVYAIWPAAGAGYAAKTLPGVREAIEGRRWDEANREIIATARALEAYSAKLDAATALLTDSAPTKTAKS